MLVDRPKLLEKLVSARGNGLVKVITGLRRSGKTVLLFNLYHQWMKVNGVSEDRIICVRLDDLENLPLRDPYRLFEYIKARLVPDRMNYVLLDEIQLVKGFEDVINSLLNRGNVDIAVTGSNSKFLSSDIATSFRGRSCQIHVKPLMFNEYRLATGKTFDQAWRDYRLYGGLPQLLAFTRPEDKESYLHDLFSLTYLADIKERNRIREPATLDALLDVIASNVGSLTNPHKLSDTYNSLHGGRLTNERTFSSYINMLEEAFLIEKARRFDIRGKSYLASPFKYYFTDVGLRNARLAFRQTDQNRVLENVVYNELRAHGWNVDVGVVNTRTTVRKQFEVDFVANRFDERIYVQIAESLPTKEKYEQEVSSLRLLGDSFRKVIVLLECDRPWMDENGFQITGLSDFLDDLT